MAKKNKKQKKPRTPARFDAGAQVRVKLGITVPDFEDIPLGGWAGTIREVDQRSAPPAVIEQPTSIITRPLNEKDQDDRVRIALGLSSDDPLPEVDDDTLRAYHRYLAAHLTFPFEATFSEETGPPQNTSHALTVLGLLDADDCDGMYGLMCQGRQGQRQVELPLGELEVKKGDPNRQLVEDYSSWFWNYR